MTKPYRPAAYSLIVMAVLAVTLHSCFVLTKWAGVHTPKQLSDPETLKFAGKCGIQESPVMVLDTSFMALERATTRIADKQHLIQPIMILHFDQSGDLVQLSTNCSYTGFPRLKWNLFHEFDTFPPALRVSVPEQSGLALTLDEFFTYCRPLNETARSEHKRTRSEQDRLVIMLGPMLKKQAKGLIKLMEEKYPDHKHQILYVINENYMYQILRKGVSRPISPTI